MLSIFDSGSQASRRDFLRIGTLGLGGLSLSSLLGARAARASFHGGQVGHLSVPAWRTQPVRDVRPQDDAPRRRSAAQTGEIATSLPGVTFGSTFPRLAELADKIAVVRSYVPGDGNHDAKPIVHRETLGANLGSFYARVVGLNHPATGMPTNMLLLPAGDRPGCPAAASRPGQLPRDRAARQRLRAVHARAATPRCSRTCG